MRKTLAVLLLSMTACGGDGTGPDNSPNLSGTWQFAGNFSHAGLAVSCQATGSVVLSHSGNNASGQATQTGSCNGPGGVANISGSFPITGGQVNGTSVSFQAGSCSYSGTYTGSPPNRMSGATSCIEAILGQNYTFTGTWQASR